MTGLMESGRNLLLDLEDNCFGDHAKSRSGHHLNDHLRFIEKWADRPLVEWEKMGVTVFTHETPVGHDGSSEEQGVFTLGGDGDGPSWVNTHNYMGVVRLRDETTGSSVQIQIGSRFDRDHSRPYFLTYMLGRVFGGAVVQNVAIGSESMWDLLLAFAFRRKLLDVVAVGLFKEYRTMHHDDARVRGRIDLDRHLRMNVPFRGKVAYVSREVSYDNPLNQLIRHALEKVRRKWPQLLEGDARLTDIARLIGRSTPTWNSSDVRVCLGLRENRRPVRHPYFQSCYEPLRKICRSLLDDEGAGLYQQEQEAEGVIFDGAWLWEEYLWTILEPLGYSHPQNKSREGGLKAIPGITFYPDFYHREKAIVLDAKYKRARHGPSIEDVRQIFGYMLLTEARHGGLIKPDGDGMNSSDIGSYDSRDGRKIRRWHDVILVPRSAESAEDFIRKMEEEEKRFEGALNALD